MRSLVELLGLNPSHIRLRFFQGHRLTQGGRKDGYTSYKLLSLSLSYKVCLSDLKHFTSIENLFLRKREGKLQARHLSQPVSPFLFPDQSVHLALPACPGLSWISLALNGVESPLFMVLIVCAFCRILHYLSVNLIKGMWTCW